jgi:hypothetical protein
MTGSRWLGAGMMGIGLLFGSTAWGWVVVPPRPGQIGVALEGQYGSFFSSGGLGSEFGAGGGLAVRARYRMQYDRALGISFERDDYQVRHASPADTADHTVTLLNTGVEFYQLFGTEGKTTRMISAGFGITQVSKKLNDGEEKLGGQDVTDGGFISLGVGLERFFIQSFGLDLNAHYELIFQNGSTNQLVEAAAGLIFYASY